MKPGRIKKNIKLLFLTQVSHLIAQAISYVKNKLCGVISNT